MKLSTRLSLLVLVILLYSPFVDSYVLDFGKGRRELDKDGWVKQTDKIKFTCAGPADMKNTPCYGKGGPESKSFSASGKYVLVHGHENCVTPDYDAGPNDFCYWRSTGSKSIGEIWFEGGVRDYAQIKKGYVFDSYLYKGPVNIDYTCRAYGHGSFVYYVKKTNCDLFIYTKSYDSCQAFCDDIDSNTVGIEKDGACQCDCGEGYKIERETLKFEGGKTTYNKCSPKSTTTTTTTTLKTTTTTLKKPTSTTFPTFNPKKDYCGPEGKAWWKRIISLLVKDDHLASDTSFKRACYNHDKCYAECAKTGNKQVFCDNMFRKELDMECHLAYFHWKKEYEDKSIFTSLKSVVMLGAGISWETCLFQVGLYEIAVYSSGDAIGAYPCKKGGNFDWLTG